MVEEKVINGRKVFVVDVGDMTADEAEKIINSYRVDMDLPVIVYNRLFWRFMKGGIVLIAVLWTGIYLLVG